MTQNLQNKLAFCNSYVIRFCLFWTFRSQELLSHEVAHGYLQVFPECVARVPVSLWGFGGKAVFAKSCSMLSTVRKARLRDRPTVCVTAVKALICANPSLATSCYATWTFTCNLMLRYFTFTSNLILRYLNFHLQLHATLLDFVNWSYGI